MRPSSSPGLNLRVLLAELAGAVLGGGVFAVVFAISLGLLLSGSNLGMGLLGVMVYTAILGSGVGTVIGVLLVGRLLNHRGNWLWAVLLSFLTGGLALALVLTLSSGSAVALLGVGLAQVAGSILGYQKTS